MDTVVSIRSMKENDIGVMTTLFNKNISVYQNYFNDQESGKRDVILAELNGEIIGYLTIMWESNYDYFREGDIPEISDFNVLDKAKRKGVGSRLMDTAEERMFAKHDAVGIGVGMNREYGAAQILYAKRGYIPDGRGLCYNGKPLKFGDETVVDHGLNMYFTKQKK